MERVVCKGILHAVTTCNLGHVVKGIVSICDIGKLGAVRRFAGDLGGSAGVVILVGRLVAAAVSHLFRAGCFLVHIIGDRITAGIGLTDQVIARILCAVAIRVKPERTVDRTKLSVGEGGLGQHVAVLIFRLVEGRGGISGFLYLIISHAGAFHHEIGGGKIGFQAVADKLDIVEVDRSAVVAVVTVYTDVLNRSVLALGELNRRELPFLGTG